jgi:Tol biopolymer transport system component
MTPERWQQVKAIFNSAIQYRPEERSSFLSEACSGDDRLRSEVESLIASHEKSGEFIDEPAYQAAAWLADEKTELKTGQQIGSYQILSFISRGGMGEVYLAQDQRLSRKVALKLLPTSFTKDTDRLRRFEQEARSASALNHPNIITIYEIHQLGPTHVIATEFVEGETLRQRLNRSRLTVSEALTISIQVADALSAAHKAGIIHRDIKPENVMLRPDGYVKVLDFGLAKLSEQAAPAVSAEAPTMQVRTGSGVVIGTAGYMSPEQARGLTVDGRSDIFSLGAMIYEMIARRKPFEGETASDTLASILKTEPAPLLQLIPGLPSELNRIVLKSLRKDQEERYQVVKDLLLDLKALKEDLEFQQKLERSVVPDGNSESVAATDSTALLPRAQTTEPRNAATSISETLSIEIKRHKSGVALVAVILLAALTFAGVQLYRILSRKSEGRSNAEILRTTQVTFSSGFDAFPAISPDGKSVAYSSDQNGNFEIYIKQLTADGAELQLTSDGQQNTHPTWSPDGQKIAYYSRDRGGIWVVSAIGGNAKQLTEFGAKPNWSKDGTQIAFQSGVGGEMIVPQALAPSTIWVVPASGGTPRQVSQPGKPEGGHSSPSWSPDGKHIVFQSSDYIFQSLWVVAVDSGEVKQITAGGQQPLYSNDGQYVYFVSNAHRGGLLRLQVSATGDAVGQPEMVVGPSPGIGLGNPTISADGRRIVYTALRTLSNLWSVPISSESGDPTGPPAQFSRDTSQRNNLAQFSPDGKKIAITRWRIGSSADIWVADADGKNLVQVTNNPATDSQPSWLPGATRIAFLSDRAANNHPMLWTIELATGKEEPYFDLGDNVQYAHVSPDGKRVAFNLVKNGVMNVWLANVSDGKKTQLTFDKELAGFPCWSPDGKWLAFEIQRGQDNHIMIMPSEGGQPTQLTFDHGKNWPHTWSHDGDKIAFAGERNGIWNIYWYSLSTKKEKQLTNQTKLNTFVRYPAWSPQANQIVYEYAEMTGNVYLLELK